MAAQCYCCHPAKMRSRSLELCREIKDESLFTKTGEGTEICLREKTFMQPNLHDLICLVMITPFP